MYLSDHGDMLGDHYMWRKAYPYESSARVPLIIHWPGSPVEARGKTVSNPVEIRDVLPTFAEAANRTIPEQVEGASLLRLIRNSGGHWREWIDLEHDLTYGPENHWNALTDGRMKYIFNAFNGQEQLFDLTSDRAEARNLADALPDDLKLWRGRLISHMSERGTSWVVDGRLGLRPQSILYSPHYPRG
jgi:arylsulfatase